MNFTVCGRAWDYAHRTIVLLCSAPSACPLVSVALFGASALPVALTRGRVGLKMPFAALAGGSLRLSLLACMALLSHSLTLDVSVYLVSSAQLSSPLAEITPPHEFFSLLNMTLLLLYLYYYIIPH